MTKENYLVHETTLLAHFNGKQILLDEPWSLNPKPGSLLQFCLKAKSAMNERLGCISLDRDWKMLIAKMSQNIHWT